MLGRLQAMRLAVPPVRLMTRALYACLQQLPTDISGVVDHGAQLRLPPAAVAEC